LIDDDDKVDDDGDNNVNDDSGGGSVGNDKYDFKEDMVQEIHRCCSDNFQKLISKYFNQLWLFCRFYS